MYCHQWQSFCESLCKKLKVDFTSVDISIENTSNIEDIRIWVDKDQSNPTEDLKVILNELNLKDKKVGIEYEAYGMTGRNALRLNKSFSKVSII